MEVGISGGGLGRGHPGGHMVAASGKSLRKFSGGSGVGLGRILPGSQGGECSVGAFKSTEALVADHKSMNRFGRNTFTKCFRDFHYGAIWSIHSIRLKVTPSVRSLVSIA